MIILHHQVLKGSGSALYGSDAIGGVVNVRTQLFEAPELRLFGGLGNFGTNEEHGVASFGGMRYSEQLDFARDFSSGFGAAKPTAGRGLWRG